MKGQTAIKPLGLLKGRERVNYYRNLFKHTLKRHNLNPEFEHVKAFQGVWQITPDLKQHWDQLFGDHCNQSIVMYPIKPIYDAAIQMCGEMGVNFINIMHFACEINFHQSPSQNWLSQPIKMQHSICDVLHYNHNRAIIVMQTDMSDMDDQSIVTQKEFMFIKNIPKRKMERITTGRKFFDIKEYEHLAKNLKDSTLNSMNAKCLGKCYFPKDLGKNYGIASGDLNPLHTKPKIAKITGHRDAFAQGGYIINLALKYLTGALGKNLSNFQVKLVSPIYFEQEVFIWLGDRHLEMQSEDGRLLSIAHFSLI